MNESTSPKRIASLRGNGCLKIQQPSLLQRRKDTNEYKLTQYVLRAKKLPRGLLNLFR